MDMEVWRERGRTDKRNRQVLKAMLRVKGDMLATRMPYTSEREAFDQVIMLGCQALGQTPVCGHMFEVDTTDELSRIAWRRDEVCSKV
jgi:hypothetical protein